MRQHLIILVGAAVLLVGGAAEAAPAFGASSHRLSGSASGHSKAQAARPLGWFEAALGLIGIDLAASVMPVGGEAMNERGARSSECETAKKTEVAKADPKDETNASGSKGRARPNEPVYLAF